MDLILWRHAEAEDGFPDMDRALTSKGHKQADKTAAWLKAHLPEDTRIIASPAKRTQQTASALAQHFITEEAIAPGASVQAVLSAVGWGKTDGCTLIVGHQPTLGAVAAHLVANLDASWSVKKSAIWWLTAKPGPHGSQATLRAVIPPELL